MRDLELQLRELGARWDAPPDPPMADTVVARLASASRPPRRTRPRRVVIALAGTALVAGSLAAIAPARNAILDFFDIGGVRVVTTSPPTTPTATQPVAPHQLGSPLTLAQARAQAPFPLRVPGDLGEPEDVFVRTPPESGTYTMRWRSPGTGGDILLTQFRGTFIGQKSVDPSVTRIEPTSVGGSDGFWLSGGPHTFGFIDETGAFQTESARVVGDVLVWERDGITYRIEGAGTLDRAIDLASSLR